MQETGRCVAAHLVSIEVQATASGNVALAVLAGQQAKGEGAPGGQAQPVLLVQRLKLHLHLPMTIGNPTEKRNGNMFAVLGSQSALKAVASACRLETCKAA